MILNGGHLEIGGETAINCNVAITCARHIRIGRNNLISWNSNIFDGNMHELIGAGATVLSATIGAWAARVVRKEVSWRL